MKGTFIRNDARRAPLSGRPLLHPYEDSFDVSELVDKGTYQRFHERKWDGASFLNNQNDDHEEIVLDTTPASTPTASPPAPSSPSSSVASSPASSRRTTEELYISFPN